MLTTILLIAVVLFLFTGKMDLMDAGCLYFFFKIGVPIILFGVFCLLL